MPISPIPLVSLVTPVYNQAPYIAETIESVLAQDYLNLEYIVLDDGSTDGTDEVLKRYAGRCVCARHDNVGQATTLNRGWSQSRGEYLGYLSADDVLLPSAITHLAKALDDHPEAVVVYGDYDLMDPASTVIKHQTADDFVLADLAERLICQPGVGVLFRREVFEKSGGWNPRLRKIPDFEFWLRASGFGTFLRVPVTVGHYRVHEQSTSVRPLSYDQSMEMVGVMHEYWSGKESLKGARFALSRAHHMAALSHAQAGRLGVSFEQLALAVRYRPKRLISLSSWKKYFGAILLKYLYRYPKINQYLR